MSNGRLEKLSTKFKAIFKPSQRESTIPGMSSKKEIPSILGKFFKTTSKARKLMDPEGRLCELDPNSHYRELVYNTVDAKKWDEMSWTQASLYEAAQKDTTMRISRKKINGTYLEILHRDVFNEAELKEYANKANMDSSLVGITLGYAQAKRNYVYIISMKTTGLLDRA